MNGRTKRILYRVFSGILSGLAGCAMLYFVYRWVVLILFLERAGQIAYGCALGAAAIATGLLLPHLALHELGHFAVGAAFGLKPRRVRIGMVSFGHGGVRFGRGKGSGESQFSLRQADGARWRLIFTTLSGPLFNLLYATTVLLLFFLLQTRGPALLFFAYFVPLNVSEGISALIPADLPEGKTDGEVVWELAHRRGESELALRVMQAQCLLRQGGYTSLPRELLFEVPVVREDSPEFSALLLLQTEYCRAAGETQLAERLEARRRMLEAENDGADGRGGESEDPGGADGRGGESEDPGGADGRGGV